MAQRHPNNLVNAMRLIGYSLTDMLPAYPGRDERYVDQLLRDCALALSRPVMPYGLLGIHPCRSQYFNVSDGGFRASGQPQPWPAEAGRTTVFMFGGSSTVGFNVEDAQTIPAQLQPRLAASGADCEVYNFGSGNYTSRHEALRFLDLLDQGIVPDVAVFLDGYNDCHYAYGNQELVDALDLLYQREKRRRRLSFVGMLIDVARTATQDRRQALPTSQTYGPHGMEPAAQMLLSDDGIRRALSESDQLTPAHPLPEVYARIGERVWDRYLVSMAMIQAMASAYGVQTLFAWQPVAWHHTAPEQRVMERLFAVYRSGVFCAPVYQWLQTQAFPSLPDAADFLDLSAIGRGQPGVLYADISHYSAAFCATIADALAERLAPRLAARAADEPAMPTRSGA